MSMYKLNKLGLMLSNDEGWRIDIPSYPELVKVYWLIEIENNQIF